MKEYLLEVYYGKELLSSHRTVKMRKSSLENALRKSANSGTLTQDYLILSYVYEIAFKLEKVECTPIKNTKKTGKP